MSLLANLASFLNPANLIQGVGNVVTGILDNISSNKPIDLSGNLSRGIKTALNPPNVDKSIIGSTGGNNVYDNQSRFAVNHTFRNLNEINKQLSPGTNRNVANLRPVVWQDRTKSMKNVITGPHFNMQALTRQLPSAPAGLPSSEITLAKKNPSDFKVANTAVLSGNPTRDQYGYKKIPALKITKKKMSVSRGRRKRNIV